MYFIGKQWKDGRHWLISVPSLDVMTQAKTKRDAFRMLKNAIKLLVNKKGFHVQIHPQRDDFFIVEGHPAKDWVALMLKRQRVKNNISLDELSRRLGVKSINAYAQYEQGKNLPSLTKIQEFLSAMNAKMVLALDVF